MSSVAVRWYRATAIRGCCGGVYVLMCPCTYMCTYARVSCLGYNMYTMPVVGWMCVPPSFQGCVYVVMTPSHTLHPTVTRRLTGALTTFAQRSVPASLHDEGPAGCALTVPRPPALRLIVRCSSTLRLTLVRSASVITSLYDWKPETVLDECVSPPNDDQCT